MRNFISALLFSALALPALAAAQPRDRVAFGHDVRVGPGEVVRDAVSFGGDTIVEGEVLGDAVSFGGDVELRGEGAVRGDVVGFGGRVERSGHASPAAHPSHHPRHHDRGPLERFWDWLGDLGHSAVSHVLLFLLGLILMGVARERLGAMQVTIVRDSLKTGATGLFAYVVAGLALVVLAISIVGIPAAVVLGLGLPLATYVGLAAAATVIGAALPVTQLRDRPVLQLGAGVGVLFLASLVPMVGGLLVAIAACVGFGALVRTRFRPLPPADLPEDGPYRSPAAA